MYWCLLIKTSIHTRRVVVIDWNLYHLGNERSVTRDGLVSCLIASWLGKAFLASSLGNYHRYLINAQGMTNTACFDPMDNQRLVQVLPWQLGTEVGGWHHEGFFLFAVFGLAILFNPLATSNILFNPLATSNILFNPRPDGISFGSSLFTVFRLLIFYFKCVYIPVKHLTGRYTWALNLFVVTECFDFCWVYTSIILVEWWCLLALFP